jgi:hypothetical protein
MHCVQCILDYRTIHLLLRSLLFPMLQGVRDERQSLCPSALLRPQFPDIPRINAISTDVPWPLISAKWRCGYALCTPTLSLCLAQHKGDPSDIGIHNLLRCGHLPGMLTYLTSVRRCLCWTSVCSLHISCEQNAISPSVRLISWTIQRISMKFYNSVFTKMWHMR